MSRVQVLADPGILEPVLGPVTGAEGQELGLVDYVAHVCADPDCARCVATGRPGAGLGSGLPEGLETVAGVVPGTVALEIEWVGEDHEVVSVFEPGTSYASAAALNGALYAAVDEVGTLYVTYQSNGVVHVWRSDRSGGDPAWVEAARFGSTESEFTTPALVAWGAGNVAVVATSYDLGVVAFVSSSADTSSVSGTTGAMGTFVEELVADGGTYDDPQHACLRVSDSGALHVAFTAETGPGGKTEIWYAIRASGTWIVEGPLDGGAGADFPTLAVTEDPLRLGGWILLGAAVPSYAVIAAWRELGAGGLDQSWYAIRTDLDPWTAPRRLTYLAESLTGSSTPFEVNRLIDPCAWFGPGGRLLVGNQQANSANQSAWLVEGEYESASSDFDWYDGTEIANASLVKQELVHGSSNATHALAVWAARSNDAHASWGVYGAIGREAPGATLSHVPGLGSLEPLEWAVIREDMTSHEDRLNVVVPELEGFVTEVTGGTIQVLSNRTDLDVLVDVGDTLVIEDDR